MEKNTLYHRLRFYRRFLPIRFFFTKVPEHLFWKLSVLITLALYICFGSNDLQAKKSAPPQVDDLEVSNTKSPILLINMGEDEEDIDIDELLAEIEKEDEIAKNPYEDRRKKEEKTQQVAEQKIEHKKVEEPKKSAAKMKPVEAKKTTEKSDYETLGSSLKKVTKKKDFEAFTIERGNFTSPAFSKTEELPPGELPVADGTTPPSQDMAGKQPQPTGDTSGPPLSEQEKTENLYEQGGNMLEVEVNEDYEYLAKIMQDAQNALLAGQNEVSVEYFKEALELDTKNTAAMLGLAVAYQQNQQYEQARKLYRDVLKSDSRNKVAVNNYLILLSQQFPGEALSEFERLYKNNPEFSLLPAQIGIINLKSGNYQEAAKSLIRAVMLAPDNIIYKYHLAIAYDKLGNYKEAARFYNEVVAAARSGKELPDSPEKIQNRLTYLLTQS